MFRPNISAQTVASCYERVNVGLAYIDGRAAQMAEQRTDKGTPPGEGIFAEDAEIVRRIRERCPDNRFDGGSDVELLQLFNHNKQVLAGSDEDVIAAMTHPR